MVEHCGGLPLAIVVLGGILLTKHSLREWKTVHKSIKSYLECACDDILALSYDELPCKLKPFFLYLGRCSEDFTINPETLYQLWIAENLVLSKDKKEGETMRDVAEYYLGELAHRNMVQVELQENELQLGRFKSCHLHDRMRDFCLSKAKEEGFFKIIDLLDGNDANPSSPICKIRKLNIYGYDDDDKILDVIDKEMFNHLRSLFFIIYQRESDDPEKHSKRLQKMLWSHLKNSKFLRVLVLEGFDVTKLLRVLVLEGFRKTFINETNQGLDMEAAEYWLDRAIGRLIHLRYLSLRGYFFVTFPSFISKLKHIQTLDLRETGIVVFDPRHANALRKLDRLRHLYLPFLTRSSSMGAKLRLDGLGNLETLINFDPSWCETKDLLKLKNIQTLTAELSENLDELDKLTNYIKSITPHPLRCLVLKVSNCEFDSQQGEMVLRNLLGYAFIYRLQIGGVPVSEGDISSSPYTIEICSMSIFERDPMPTLENLGQLNILSLVGNAYSWKEILCSAMGFPQLRILVLQELHNLKKWTVHEGAMPKLSHLEIVCCTKLKMLPEGLRFVTTLQELKIGEMPEAFKKRIRIIDGEEGEDFFKVRHVPNILMD